VWRRRARQRVWRAGEPVAAARSSRRAGLAHRHRHGCPGECRADAGVGLCAAARGGCRVTPLLLPLAVFLSSAASLCVELAVVRLGAPYVGQSLLPWSAAIAGVLIGLTAGHVLGGIASARSRDI